MNHLRTSLLSAAAVPVLLAFAWPASELVFAPAEGQGVTRKWTNQLHLSLDDMQMTMNGQPLPMEIEMEMDIDGSTEVEVTDQYVAMASGRPKQLRRTFDAVSSTGSFAMEMEMMPGGGQTRDITASSELEGKTVTFSWDEDDEGFGVEWYESEGDDKLLEGLTEDMDLRILLPDSAVEEGDTWEIDVQQLASIVAPGGNLSLVPEMDEDMGGMPGMEGMGSGMADMVGENLEGTATAEYKGTQEVDGVTVAVIALTLDIESTNDMTEKVTEQMGQMPDEVGEVSVEYMDVELDIEAEGTLFWNIEAKHAHSMDLSGSIRMVMDTAMTMSPGGQEMQMEQMFEMSGTFENSMTVSDN